MLNWNIKGVNSLKIIKENGGFLSDWTKYFYKSKANHENMGYTKMVKEFLKYHQQHQKWDEQWKD